MTEFFQDPQETESVRKAVDWKDMYFRERDSHSETAQTLSRTVSLVNKLESEKDKYIRELDYFRGQVREIIERCERLRGEAEHERERALRCAKSIFTYKEEESKERRES